MNEQYSIVKVMMRDHAVIQKLLHDFKDKSSNEDADLIQSFHRFEWALEKHLFTEEKAIFTMYNPEDVYQGYKMLPELTKQHNVLLNKLSLIREDIRKKRIPKDLSSFSELLISHKNYEEEHLYPKLDDALSDAEKKSIIDKINDIVLQ
ncbi:MAG: hemerythrin domain-containing protein [Thermoplasmatota archaeon]